MISFENWIGAALIAVSAAAGIYGYSKVPREKSIAIHFNAAGFADGFAPALVAFFVIPLIGLAIFGVTAWQGAVDSVGRISWSSTTVVPLVVQAVLCLGQFIIVARALRD